MSPLVNPGAADPARVAADQIHRHERRVDAAVMVAGGASVATLGALIGSMAGPPGAIAGALVGAAIGAATGAALESSLHSDTRHDAELDEEIGVSSGPLGAAPVRNVPEEPLPESQKLLDELDETTPDDPRTH